MTHSGESRKPPRLGIFGGTFDPVHYGHLLLAECCREQCGLDEVWFLPAASPPHKRRRELTPAPLRIEMLELAIGGYEPFSVCRLEIQRGGLSYTVETLAEIHEQRPEAELFFLLGGDSWHDLPSWKQPERICQLATLVIVHRPQSPAIEPAALSQATFVGAGSLPPVVVEMPQIDLASRDLRQRVAAGRGVRFRTPRAVEKYIETHGLYRPAE
ncbi:MAG TPA: nicotinate-nucleotide adenylyltransferase [Pirellulales bacterium]